MSEWKEYKLGELCTKIGSGATPTGGSNAYKLSGISLIRSQNVLDFKFSYEGLAFIDEEQARALKNVAVQEGDVLINITGDSVARVCKVVVGVLPARVNQHVAILRPDKIKLNSNYLLYYLQAEKESLLIHSEIGGTRNALTKAMLEDYDLLLPSPPEQIAIASILSNLDDKIDLLHRQNKTLEALASTLFRKWFVEDTGEDWEGGKLQDYIHFEPREQKAKGEQLFFDMKCLSNNSLSIDEGIYRDVSSATSFRNGDTLLAKITPCLENGKTGFVMNLQDGEIARGSTEFIVMRSKGIVSPYWIYCLSRDEDFREQAIQSMTGTSGRQRVQIGLLKNIEIRMDEARMKEFHEAVLPFFKKIKSNDQQIHTLSKLRDSLLPKLLSGELRLN